MQKNNSGKLQIHGKEYLTVPYRVEQFRKKYPIDSGWAITTFVLESGKQIVVRAKVVSPKGVVVATGHAEEVRGSTQVNQTSALENCETSAIGRALAAAGFGGSEFASANEVENAIHQQRQYQQQQRNGGQQQQQHQRNGGGNRGHGQGYGRG